MTAQCQPHRAILSLGSNLGDRLAWLSRACAAIAGLEGTRIAERSPVYETDPVDVPERFADARFLNCVLLVETALPPDAFSNALHAIEARLERVRGTERHQPRTIDIDIIAFDDLVSTMPDLVLPHPCAHLRRFVLQPLADLRPDLRLPGFSQSVAELLAALPTVPRVARFADALSGREHT
jgi:2-amino-4-hydroxy-6-hydroxymethyldihydropteridine diphosphokinase